MPDRAANHYLQKCKPLNIIKRREKVFFGRIGHSAAEFAGLVSSIARHVAADGCGKHKCLLACCRSIRGFCKTVFIFKLIKLSTGYTVNLPQTCLCAYDGGSFLYRKFGILKKLQVDELTRRTYTLGLPIWRLAGVSTMFLKLAPPAIPLQQHSPTPALPSQHFRISLVSPRARRAASAVWQGWPDSKRSVSLAWTYPGRLEGAQLLHVHPLSAHCGRRVQFRTVKHGSNRTTAQSSPPQAASEQEQQQQQPKGRQLKNRIVFGIGIGLGVAGAVFAGGWVFTLSMSAAVLVATGEYFDLVSSKGIATGMRPPPVFASRVCSAICAAMPLMTLYFGGRVGVAMSTASFLLAMMLLLQQGIPHFSQLTSAIFGLLYLGYLPSFWIKLRCGLAVPALQTKIAEGFPMLLGGPSHWTVGLVATLISFSCIIAADTGAFFGGKYFGKTPLNDVSPKKTLEGAIAGLSASVLVTVLLSHLLQWPSNLFSAAALALLVFLASLFGDLTESMIKRDAGVKDSGRLIPGHGGILDRTDSYIFTGALVYSFVKIGLPLFGV